MDGKILFDISHLRYTGKEKIKATINDGEFILSNEDNIREGFYSDVFKKQYGLFETNYIPQNIFAYTHCTLENTDKKLLEEIQMEFEEIMYVRQQYIESLLTFLWFVKDNSIGLYSTIGETAEGRLTGKISKSISYWTCEGEKATSFFSKEEILEAASLTFKFRDISTFEIKSIHNLLTNFEFDQNGKPFKRYLERRTNYFDYNSQNAIERAFTFLITARSQPIIIYKIAYYMAVFESLFTTSSNEITMRMSYRVAFYIGETAEDCKAIFDNIYNSYNIRSRFIHGQPFKSNKEIELNKLKAIAKSLDDLLRHVFRKILIDDSKIFTEYSNDERDRYLNSLIFSLPFERNS